MQVLLQFCSKMQILRSRQRVPPGSQAANASLQNSRRVARTCEGPENQTPFFV